MTNLTPTQPQHADLIAGFAQSADGYTVSLGSFAEYADDDTNLCAECSSDGTPNEAADVTDCENCGLPIEGRRSLWA